VTRYELLDRIGVGGMAELFRGKAVAAGGFEKPVAIKRILPQYSQDARFVELLIAEAKVLSLLKHRNIVQIFDVGLGDDDKYFLVMEYVDGKDLGAVQRAIEARRRRMPYDLALHVAAEICEALEHAHTARAPDGKAMSLVHRDVSPSNVLLSRAGEVKLTDFGIARRAEQEQTSHGARRSAVRGKFAYMSPEQARNEQLDPRSDVFAVGILLWELVTNRRLFSGLTELEAAHALHTTEVPRPRELDPRLDPEIDRLIMTALARVPTERPTAGQLAAQLRTLRYSLDVTVGDPATELARFIEAAEEVERRGSQKLAPRPPRPAYDGGEPTVIRIHTADAFSMHDMDGTGMARAREVIDRFDEEETRQAALSSEQMAFLRRTAPRDSGEQASIEPPAPALPYPLPGVRAWQATEEPTRMRELPPLSALSSTDDLPTFAPGELEANPQFDPDDATRMVAPVTRRTPPPERIDRIDRNDRIDRIIDRIDRIDRNDRIIDRPERNDRIIDRPERNDRIERNDRNDRIERNDRPAAASAVPPLPPAPPRGHTPLPSPTPSSLRNPLERSSRGGLLTPPLTPANSHPLPPGATLPPPPPLPPGAALPPPPPLPGSDVQPLPLPPPPPAGYPHWNQRAQLPGGLPPPQPMFPRTSTNRISGGVPRRRPLHTWMLVIGALVMALLAFAVTRACIHSAATRPPAETK